VNNCKTRLWQIIDGRRVCQNGHVQEGDLEVGEDEDDFVPSQRRLDLPSQRSKTQEQKEGVILYGVDGHGLYMQCVQLLLRKQVKWLIEEKRAPVELEQVVRSLWAMEVNASKFANMPVGDGQEETKGSEPAVGIELLHTVAICYLGCLLVQFPIYVYDLNRWIYRCEFPFMNAIFVLPRSVTVRLLQYYQRALSPRSLPSMGLLHDTVCHVIMRYKKSYGLTFPPINWKPLLYKMVSDLLLPPEIYLAAERLAVALDLSFEYEETKNRTNTWSYPELSLMTTVLFCTKMCFGLDGVGRFSANLSTPACQHVDWQMWADLLRKFWVEDECFFDADERDVLFWDSAKISRYLTWFEGNVGFQNPPQTNEVKLYDLFPVGGYELDGRFVPSKDLPREILAPDPSSVAEIMRVIQGTTFTVVAQGPHKLPGQGYERYRDRMYDPPPLIRVLQQSAMQMSGVTANELRGRLYFFEARCLKFSETLRTDRKPPDRTKKERDKKGWFLKSDNRTP
jgi:RNA polymerase I-specific transcription initiation factor RRN7